jgi:hypothetical protein
MARNIFVSYRREDSKHAAGRLVDRLSRNFDPGQLFLDVDNVEPGLDFKKVLTDKVQQCDVLLAVIGPGWLDTRDATGARRLDSPKDFVRIEIEAALARDVRVIPVLVDGARIPGEEELPEPLRTLAHRHAVNLTHERFASDADNLASALARMARPRWRIWLSQQSGIYAAAKAYMPLAVAIAFVVAAQQLTTQLAVSLSPTFSFDFTKGLSLGFAISLLVALAIVWKRGPRISGAEVFFYWLGCAVQGAQWFYAAFMLQLAIWLDINLSTNMLYANFFLALVIVVVSGIGTLFWWKRRHPAAARGRSR